MSEIVVQVKKDDNNIYHAAVWESKELGDSGIKERTYFFGSWGKTKEELLDKVNKKAKEILSAFDSINDHLKSLK